MVQLQIAHLPRSGTQERWRRLCQEGAGLLRDRFASSCQQVASMAVLLKEIEARRPKRVAPATQESFTWTQLPPISA